MHQLEWAMRYLDIWLKIVYGMFVSMFLKNINIWIGWLRQMTLIDIGPE